MIKINLLHSVTERNVSSTVSVERKIASPASRLMLMSIAVGFLLAAVIGWDVISTQMAKTEAERQLEEQKVIAAQLESVMKEQKELEAKIQSIDTRIEAIKKLRSSQAGPSAVLEAVSERIRMTPGLYLESIEQTGDLLTIKGNSPDEAAVTRFSQSLEFSGGLFSNFNIETQRKDIVSEASTPAPGSESKKIDIVNFTVKCAYTPSKANQPKDGNPTTASNASPQQPGAPAPTTPPQVAKN